MKTEKLIVDCIDSDHCRVRKLSANDGSSLNMKMIFDELMSNCLGGEIDLDSSVVGDNAATIVLWNGKSYFLQLESLDGKDMEEDGEEDMEEDEESFPA